VHFVTCRTKNGEIDNLIVLTISIEVRYFQNFCYAEAAMNAINLVVIMSERKFSVIDSFHLAML
jgi:hypothetical protein